jgi:hypothetical protein
LTIGNVDEIEVGALEAIHTLRRVFLRPEGDLVEIGERVAGSISLPVAGVLDHDEAVVRHPGLQRERARSNEVRRARRGVIELRRCCDPDTASSPEKGRKSDPRHPRGDNHSEVVHGPNVGDVGENDTPERSGAVRLEVLYDRNGVQGLTIVECDALAQGDRPLRVVLVVADGPRQVRNELPLGVWHRQGVVDGLRDFGASGSELRVGKAPTAGRVRLDTIGDRASLDWRRILFV